MDVRWATASDLGRGIASGEVDPEALLDAYLAATAAHDAADAIFARLTEDRARAEAASAAGRARTGTRRGPLDGVPISWKDLFDSAEVATEAGTRLLEGRVPKDDAATLALASQGGAVCLGKTHMSELAFSGLGLNPMTATPPGRHDADAVPGGSSSGAAASVAHGLAPLAMGSDTGGSIRVPAAWNDLVGFKPSFGRLSTAGTVPLVESIDVVGPLARSVEDAALCYALCGGDPVDLRGATLEGARLLVLEDHEDGARDAPRAAFGHGVLRLEEAGAIVERRTLDIVSEAVALSPLLFAPEAYAIWRDTIEAAPHLMYDRILERFRGGRDALAADVLAAWRTLRDLRSRYFRATAGFDAVLLPTAPNLPPSRTKLLSDDAYYVQENLLTLSHTRVGNVLDLCGLTVPTGVPSCGLMLLTPARTEARLLRLGAAAEAALA